MVLRSAEACRNRGVRASPAVERGVVTRTGGTVGQPTRDVDWLEVTGHASASARRSAFMVLLVLVPSLARPQCIGAPFVSSGKIEVLPPYWGGESFVACSTGELTSIQISIEALSSADSKESQAAQLVLGTGAPTGAPEEVQVVQLVRGVNVLHFDSPRPVVEGNVYYFAIGSDHSFTWPNLYYGLAPTPPAANGSFTTDWSTVRPVNYCEFAFDIAIVPETGISSVTWGAAKSLFR